MTLRTVRAHSTSTVAIALAAALVIAIAAAASCWRPAASRCGRSRHPRPARPAPARRREGRSWWSPTARDPFGGYYAEILRAEGLNEFAVADTASLSAATLAGHQVVLLGRRPR